MITKKYINYLIIAFVIIALGITAYLIFLNYNQEHQKMEASYASYFSDEAIMAINITVEQEAWDNLIINA
ncbi:MAG: hypothetical protein MJ157_01025, partial [Clostridia bacterium]|nr:hypothetical protein [Clostridia bacterium]